MSNLLTITSDNRPGNPTNGNLFYETDTNRLLLYYDGWKAYGTTNVTQQEASDIVVSLYGEQAYNNALALAKTGDIVFNTDHTSEGFAVWNQDTSVSYVYGPPRADHRINQYPTKVSESSISAEITNEALSGADENKESGGAFKIYDNNNPVQSFLFVDEITGQKGYLYNNKLMNDHAETEGELQEYFDGVPVVHGMTRDEYVTADTPTDGIVVFDSVLEDDNFPFFGVHNEDSITGKSKQYNLGETDATWCFDLSAQTWPLSNNLNKTPYVYTTTFAENVTNASQTIMFSTRFELYPHDENLSDERVICGYSPFLILKKYTADGDTEDTDYGKYYLTGNAATTGWTAPGLYAATEAEQTQVQEGIWWEEGVKYNFTLLADPYTYDPNGGGEGTPTGSTRVRFYRDGVKIHENISADGTYHGATWLRYFYGMYNQSNILTTKPLNAKVASAWMVRGAAADLTITEANVQEMHAANLHHDRLRELGTVDSALLDEDDTNFSCKITIVPDYHTHARNNTMSSGQVDHPTVEGHLGQPIYVYRTLADEDGAKIGTNDSYITDPTEYSSIYGLFE